MKNTSRGWTTKENLDELLELFKKGEIDKRSLVERIYGNYKNVRGVEPDIEGQYNRIRDMSTKNVVICLKMDLIIDEGIIKQYPTKWQKPRGKCPDEKKLERLSKELY